jgi:hypothetical protein
LTSARPYIPCLHLTGGPTLGLVPPDPSVSDLNYIQGNAAAPPRRAGGAGRGGGGRGGNAEGGGEGGDGGGLTVQGLPLIKLHYAQLMILITGASGNVGREVLKQISQAGHRVRRLPILPKSR